MRSGTGSARRVAQTIAEGALDLAVYFGGSPGPPAIVIWDLASSPDQHLAREIQGDRASAGKRADGESFAIDRTPERDRGPGSVLSLGRPASA